MATSLLLIEELLVTAHLLLHDASLEGSSLFDFFLFEKLDVLFLKILIHTALLNLSTASGVLLLELLIKLLLDESLAFLITEDGLFLLLVVKKGVELLDGSPLILLFNLRVDLSLSPLRPRPPTVGVKSLFLFCSFMFWASTLGKLGSTRHLGASN